jgi:hypothetical protein
MTRAFARPLLIGLIAGALGLSVEAAAQDKSGLATYKNDRHGFTLSYPTRQFIAFPPATPDGLQFVSKDGKARMLVGTLANFDGKNLKAYRTFLLNESYPGANVTYAPVRDTWFVVSGVKSDGTTAFYQRVNFVCGGKTINSWTVIFPDAQKKDVYAPIIEQVHRDYRLGDGNCAKLSLTQPPRQKNAAK